MKKLFHPILCAILVALCISSSAQAQLRYESQTLLIGDVQPMGYYPVIVKGHGIYFSHTNGRFIQLEGLATGGPRLAGHNDRIVFYNSTTSTYNSIQVNTVYNYSDETAKTNVTNFNCGLDVISRLRPVSYNFKGGEYRKTTPNEYTGDNAEIGLIAQELEDVLPNLVTTDDDGKKLVNYMALIPVLIDAVQDLQKEVEDLKKQL